MSSSTDSDIDDNQLGTNFVFCLTQRRCAYCRFLFVFDDDVVLRNVSPSRRSYFHEAPITSTETITLKLVPTNGWRETLVDEEHYHPGCKDWLPAPLTPDIGRTMCHSFEGPGCYAQDVQRRQRISQLLGHNLGRDQPRLWKGPQLPLELWMMVAEHLSKECAVVDTWDWLISSAQRQPNSTNTIDISQPVYATFVKIQGRYYVSTLSNRSGAKTHGRKTGSVLVIPARQTKRADIANVEPSDGDAHKEDDGAVFFADDQLGIRKVVFVPRERREAWCASVKSEQHLWWDEIPRGQGPISATVEMESVKARDMYLPDNLPSVRWEIPAIPPHFSMQIADVMPMGHAATRSYDYGVERQFCLRMKTLEVNGPDTVGYGVATDGHQVLAVVPHRPGVTDVHKTDPLYAIYGKPKALFWVYMPINDGEYITEILIQPPTSGPGKMVFCTNKNRMALFGYSMPRGVLSLQSTTGRLPGGRPSRVWLNQVDLPSSPTTERILGLDEDVSTAGQVEGDRWPGQLQEAPSAEHHLLIQQDVIYTKCSMEHVTEVKVCLSWNGKEALGLLLTYADGHRESVGTYRATADAQTIKLEETDKLYFTGKRERFPWYRKSAFRDMVATVSKNPPTVLYPDKYNKNRTFTLATAQRGTLEWFYTRKHSRVWYGGEWLHSYTAGRDPLYKPRSSIEDGSSDSEPVSDEEVDDDDDDDSDDE